MHIAHIYNIYTYDSQHFVHAVKLPATRARLTNESESRRPKGLLLCIFPVTPIPQPVLQWVRINTRHRLYLHGCMPGSIYASDARFPGKLLQFPSLIPSPPPETPRVTFRYSLGTLLHDRVRIPRGGKSNVILRII